MDKPTNDYLQSELRVAVFPVDVFSVPDLSVYEQMVYIVLQSYCNAHDRTAFPKIQTIAEKARMSVRKVQYCINTLIEKGLIEKQQQYIVTTQKKIRQTSNRYTVKTPSPKPKQGVHDVQGMGAHRAGSGVHDVHTNLLTNPSLNKQTRYIKNAKKSNVQTSTSEKDPRYSKFYQLFPDE